MHNISKKAFLFVSTMALMCGLLLSVAMPAQAAKMASVYVVTSNKGMDSYGMESSYEYTYNKKGFLKKCESILSTCTYKYSGTKIIESVDTPKGGYDSLEKETEKNTYNKKGLLSKTVATTKTKTTTTKYKYDKKKHLKSMSVTTKEKGETTKSTSKIKCNSKGQITKLVADGITISYKYDSYGMVKKETWNWRDENGKQNKHVITYENKYKNGRLVKKIARSKSADPSISEDYEDVTTYKYKKIQVPKKYLKKVKEQQKSIVANNML